MFMKKNRQTKFQEKSRTGMVGYEPNGDKVWEVESQRFVVLRDVIVDETTYLTTRPGFQAVRGNF